MDKSLCSELYQQDYKPLIATDQELCSRLYVDLLGVRGTAEELRTECIGKPIEDVIDVMQKNETYRKAQRRRWADRLSYSDAKVDVLSIKDLDDLVDQLYQGKINYREFGTVALSHPGFVGRYIEYGVPEFVAQAAFKDFLGRAATRPEYLDLSNLWRPWFSSGGVLFPPEDAQRADGIGIGGSGGEPYVDAMICEAGKTACESTLFGDASIQFPTNGRTGQIFAKDLTPDDWDALRAPGRLFVDLDMYWEAEVDFVLKQYLGYDLGELRPRARQALVDEFRKTGDVRALEKMVLTSWAYRQSAKEIDGKARPDQVKLLPFAYGPTKLMTTEEWLHSIAKVIGHDLGECDWRYPNLPDYGVPAELQAVLGDYYPRDSVGAIDKTFRDMARKMGGCPGAFDGGSFSVTERSNHIGLLTAVAQEESLVQICFLTDTPGLIPDKAHPMDSSPTAIRGAVLNFFGRMELEPSDEEVTEAFEKVQNDCTTCTVEDTGRGLCSGLLGGIEFMTY